MYWVTYSDASSWLSGTRDYVAVLNVDGADVGGIRFATCEIKAPGNGDWYVVGRYDVASGEVYDENGYLLGRADDVNFNDVLSRFSIAGDTAPGTWERPDRVALIALYYRFIR